MSVEYAQESEKPDQEPMRVQGMKSMGDGFSVSRCWLCPLCVVIEVDEGRKK